MDVHWWRGLLGQNMGLEACLTIIIIIIIIFILVHFKLTINFCVC